MVLDRERYIPADSNQTVTITRRRTIPCIVTRVILKFIFRGIWMNIVDFHLFSFYISLYNLKINAKKKTTFFLLIARSLIQH